MSLTGPAPDHRYFFLSYAHSAPLSGGVQSDTDHWVREFFQDLSHEVARLAGVDERKQVGFVDYLVTPGANWKSALTGMLGAANVFVPLYSPGYFNKSWPMRERASFLQRLDEACATPEQARHHVVPVLWIPLPEWDNIPELGAALVLGAGVPEYAENGLRALRMLASYRSQYVRILQRLAHRIVEVAQDSPLPRSRAMAIDDVPVPRPPQTETPLVVAVLAANANPSQRRAARHRTAGSWRPFSAAQEQPVAEYTASVAERLGLPTRVVDTAREMTLLDNCPTVLLIDPWILDSGNPTDALSAVSTHLHPWVTPVLVTDRRDPQYAGRGPELIATATATLRSLGARRVKEALDVEQLAQVMPAVLSDARRQYLRHAPVFLPKGSQASRPRLVGDDIDKTRNFEKRNR